MAIVATGQLTLIDLNDSKQLVAYIGSSQPKTVIYNPNDGTYNPNYSTGGKNQILTPQLFIAGTNTDVASSAKSTRWFYQTNGTGTPTEITASGSGYTLATSGVKTLTISSNVLQSNSSMTYICEMVFTDTDTGFDVTAKAEIELVKVTNGQKGDVGTNAITAFITNSAVTLPATTDGTVSVFTGSGTDIYVYDGTTPLTFTTGTAGNGQFTISTTSGISPANGVTLATPTAGSNPNRATYGNITAFAKANDIVTVTYTISGKSLTGATINATVVQTFTKSKAGNDAVFYWLTPDYAVISKNGDTGALVPATVKAQGYSQTGSASAVTTTSFKWLVGTSTDGTTFTDGSVQTATSVSQATNVANLKAIRFRQYLTSVTPSATNFIDEQIVYVVTDGKTGNDSVIASVWTPEGNTLKNSEGNLVAQVRVFKGTGQVAGTAFKWYIQDPTATVASGGDSDSGDGWRKLTSTYNAGVTGYDTDTITIPPSAIAGLESFLCVVTYGGKNYKDAVTVIDVTDPIAVTIIGLNTFKNGVGTTDLTARVYRNGAEIDNAGTEYTYVWSLYNQQNQKITPVYTTKMTGKTITVDGRDFDVRANIICEVSK